MNDTDLIMAAAGGVCVVVAAIAWIGDLRRMKRRDLDRVGFMPWTTVFFIALMGAVLLLGISAKDWFGR
ncbi:hypothetical protein EDF56_101577 [Novosphingobium sp. PhB165]|uniref:hypothetical protein n=1 Tax=Novosphingobium sp. PhB165 TaxID=2485105 RepID=UPI001051D9EA|nr:hypothetical protein [Novosphingobium sp. PhB165]TCM21900.1 hypothetical protein EDF56_101577 [Novosphingobium sp. PhB165]